MKIVILLVLAAVYVYGAPAAPEVDAKIQSLRDYIENLEKQKEARPENVPFNFYPQKRMVAWQPMKRGFDDSTIPLIHAIEARLSEVLRAGERLGVNPEEVLADLRSRNQLQ